MVSSGLVSASSARTVHPVILPAYPHDDHMHHAPSDHVRVIDHPEGMDLTQLSTTDIHHKIAQILGQPSAEIMPLMQSGAVRIVSTGPESVRVWVQDVSSPVSIGGRQGVQHPGGGLHGKAGWHHRRPQSFGGR